MRIAAAATPLIRSSTAYMVAVALCLATLAAPARAAPQVSSEFKRVAKALAKRVASDQLQEICEEEGVSNVELCKAITNSASAAFEMAIEGSVDEEALTAALVELATSLTQAAATDAARRLIDALLADLGHETENRCQLVTTRGGSPVPEKPSVIAGEISTCLIAQALGSTTKDCKDLEKRIQDLKVACKNANGVEVRNYKALVAVKQLKDLLSGSAPSDFYGAVAKAVGKYDSFYAGIDSPQDQSIFSDEELAAVLVPNAPSDARCTNVAATRARLTAWNAERYGVFVTLSQALATFEPLPEAVLARIPVDLPDPGCPAGHPLAQATANLQRYSNTYRTDVTLVATLDPLVLPAFLGALLVDYARDRNETKLRRHLEDFALRALARAIAAHDRNGALCSMTEPAPTPGTAKCTRFGSDKPELELTLPSGVAPPDETTPASKAEALERQYDRHTAEIHAVFESRFSPSSARRTCEYQAVASALGHNIEVGPMGLCRKLSLPGGFDVFAAGGPFAALLTPPAGVAPATDYAKWSPDQRVEFATGGARVALAAPIDANVGYSSLLLVLRGAASHLAGSDDFGSILALLEDAFEPLVKDEKFDFSRVVLAEGARRIRPLVDPFLDRQLIPIACADRETASDLRCGVRVLIGAVYDPLLDYVIIENPTDADRRRLATKAYSKALELDPLSRTPFLFNVGLGATAITTFDDDETFHLTLLEKFGLAYRFGDRNDWELGGFVGGFLDAVIREATESEDEQYWLAGATFGRRQLGSSVPFGVGVHAGAALPFDLTNTKDRIAFAGGLVLSVPADIAFGD
ncbi:MAG TPA: hypothetical protein VFZ53_04745 [Polyangiaceae bacterium]